MNRSTELVLYHAVTQARKLVGIETSLAGAVTRACALLEVWNEEDRQIVLRRTAEAVAGVAQARLWMQQAGAEGLADRGPNVKREALSAIAKAASAQVDQPVAATKAAPVTEET